MYVFLLGMIPQGIRPSQHRTALPSVIVLGFSQVEDASSQEIKRLFTDRMRTQAMTKLRDESPSTLFYSPLSPSLMASS